MAVYVDEIFPTSSFRSPGWKWKHACHMWADTIPELHAFAKKLGMRRAWFQAHPRFPHYDLTRGWREQAIKLGAQAKSLREYIREKRDGSRASPA